MGIVGHRARLSYGVTESKTLARLHRGPVPHTLRAMPRWLAAAVVIVSFAFGRPAFAERQKAPLREVMMKFRAAVENQPKPVVSLVTMGIGSLIWERHGHIALCVHFDNPV